MARKRIRGTEPNNDISALAVKVDNKGNCPHLGKGIDIGSLKKACKKKGEIRCQMCKKNNNVNNKSENSPSDQELWICMKCGNVGCGNVGYGNCSCNHGLRHFITPHSDCHAIVAVKDAWTVRCLQCDLDINLDENIRAFDAVEYLKKNFGVFKGKKEEVEEVPIPAAEDKKPAKVAAQEFKRLSASSHKNQHALPILGLENIGNTCYMNAVLQALAQTPGFISGLESLSQNAGVFILPGGENLISKEHGGFLPSLEGKLGETGQLTKAVLKLIRRVKDGKQLRKSGITNENPGDVLRLMKKISNTFYIGEQHDSHELLRLLLEGLRTEDLKRYQRGILNSLRICSNAKEVTPKEREQFLAYKKQAMQNELAVDKIFCGTLVSILKCMECGEVTTNFENFLDISLPIDSEKPKVLHSERVVVSEECKPSKHQLKKERKLARRGRKRNKGGRNLLEPSPVDSNKNQSSNESASDSEADVEDNLDSENVSKSTSGDTIISQNDPHGAIDSVSKCNEDDFLSGSSSFLIIKDASENTKCNLDNRFDLLTPEVSTVVSSSSPEQSMLLLSPESSGLTHSCSPEPSILDDFGSCEGGRGSPASSIEQADWDDEGNFKGDVSVLLKGIMKDLQVSEGTCPPPEPFEYSEEDNAKEGLWIDAIKEVGSDSQLDMISSRPDTGETVDNENRKCDEPCGNLENDKLKADNLDVNKCFMKQEESNGMYNDLDSIRKALADVSIDNSALVDMNKHDIVSAITLAPQPQLEGKLYSIFNCLNQFFSKEVLCDANQIGCLQCTKMKSGQEPKPNTKLVQANALKQLLFVKLPKILTFHFKRFEVLHSRMSKVTRKVSFPLVLDISPYTSNRTSILQQNNIPKYELYAVVEHSGHMTSGHYVAYVRVNDEEKTEKMFNIEEQNGSAEIEVEDQKNNKNNFCQMNVDNLSVKWYLISDTQVREVTYNEVSNAEAYLLFYKQLS